MAIQGLQNTTSFDTPGGRRPQNYREGILRLYPNGGGVQKAPLTALTAVMKSESTDDPVYHWFTKKMASRRLKLSADLSASTAGTAQTISIDPSVSDAYAVKARDLLYVENTGEILVVSADPSANNQVPIVRGYTDANGTAEAAVVIATVTNNPFLKVIGSAFPENSLAPTPVALNPEEVFNQTQIFRSTYGMSGTAKATTTRTGPEWAEARRDCLEMFTSDMEMAFFFGEMATKIVNGQPLRMTGGILSQIPSSRKFIPASGQVDVDWLDMLSQEVFRYGSLEKVAFCGSAFLTQVARAVRKAGQGQYSLSEVTKEYGMGGFQRLNTPNGTLVLKIHPLFSEMTQTASPTVTGYTAMAGAAVVLDMVNLKYVYMKGRDVQHQDRLELPGTDGSLSGFIGEVGLKLLHPDTHSVISGVYNAKAPT